MGNWSRHGPLAKKGRWTVIFTKAYALLAQEFPELRRAYVRFPWPHLYEYPISKATIMIEREYQGELTPWSIVIKDPAHPSLQDIGRDLNYATSMPFQEIKHFRRAIRFSRLPRLLRRALWWVGLNWGRQRANYFGTFGVSVYSALQVESLHPLSPLTTTINYGVMTNDGTVDVRIIYDHRVLNGGMVGRMLVRLEQILNSIVLKEVQAVASSASVPAALTVP